MNLERAAMKGQLAELKETARRLRLRIEGNCTAVRGGLNTSLRSVDDLQIPVVAEQMDELVSAWAELQVTNSRIARLQQELD